MHNRCVHSCTYCVCARFPSVHAVSVVDAALGLSMLRKRLEGGQSSDMVGSDGCISDGTAGSSRTTDFRQLHYVCAICLRSTTPSVVPAVDDEIVAVKFLKYHLIDSSLMYYKSSSLHYDNADRVAFFRSDRCGYCR